MSLKRSDDVMDERQRLKSNYDLTDDQFDSLLYIFNMRGVSASFDVFLTAITYDRREMDLLLGKFGLDLKE